MNSYSHKIPTMLFSLLFSIAMAFAILSNYANENLVNRVSLTNFIDPASYTINSSP